MFTNLGILLFIGLALSLAPLGGCKAQQQAGEDTPRGDQAGEMLSFDEEAARLLGTPGDESGVLIGQGPATEATWTIILGRIGTGDPETIQRLLDAAHEQLPDARTVERRDTVFLGYGAFADPKDDQAQAALARVRTIEIDGVRPFRGAFFAPPSGDDLGGTNPAYDLRNATEFYGSDAVYTLQVAIYGRNDDQKPTSKDIAAFRKAAEGAVRVFRSEGELAFYYHAPRRSTVTVGVYSRDDLDTTTTPAMESIALREAKKRHPLNLLNGAPIRVKRRGEEAREQPSFLVAVPKR